MFIPGRRTTGMSQAWIWIKTMYLRITITKVTTIFFLFSFGHCFAQTIVQSFLFTFDRDANHRVSSIVSAAQVPTDEVAWLTRANGDYNLRLCKHVPVVKDHEDQCELIFGSENTSIPVPTGFKRSTRVEDAKDLILADPIVDQNSILGVNFTSSSINNGSVVFLDGQCTRVLLYADQVLRNSKREELALIGSEFWLFGISVYAIMYDSIPHLIAGLLWRIISTGWSAYEIWRTTDIHRRFDALILHGPCQVDLFPNYFHERLSVQIVDVVLNACALSLSIFLVRNLALRYGRCMFKRVGAPRHLVRLYRLFLGSFVCLQMSVYLLVTSTSLWVDQLINGTLINISSHNTAYVASFTVLNVCLIPWISMGWFSVRLEQRRTMIAFLALGIAYVVGWSVLYYSQVFRWTWLQWPFFASLSVAAQAVQLSSVILGVICLRGFGKGLKQYLHTDDALARADFEPDVFPHVMGGDPEKQGYDVDFRVITLDAESIHSEVDVDINAAVKGDKRYSMQ